jgi:hypothetical protein
MMFAWLRFPRFASGKWTIRGLDSFAEVTYSLPGAHRFEAKVRRAARKFVHTLARLQPSAVSGDQKPVGIRDRAYIVRPGRRSRSAGLVLRALPMNAWRALIIFECTDR